MAYFYITQLQHLHELWKNTPGLSERFKIASKSVAGGDARQL